MLSSCKCTIYCLFDKIASLFSNKFKELYNCVGYDQVDMEDLQKDINICIQNDCVDSVNVIQVCHIKKALKMLKSGKKDCVLNFFTDNILHGTDRLFSLIALLFTVMLRHGLHLSRCWRV